MHGLCRCRRLGLSVAIAALCAILSSCGVIIERGDRGVFSKSEPQADAIPKKEPHSRYGNPDSYEVFGKRYRTLNSSHGFTERGVASWYGKKFHGRRTSSGETYDMHQMTAAHKHLPLPSYVKVTNIENGRSTTVRVNDRGPFHDNRIIDVSYAAARKLGLVEKGTAFVELRAVSAESLQYESIHPVNQANTPAGGSLYLQIGAFRERPNAERMFNQITRQLSINLSKNIRIRESTSGKQAIYRVQLGPIATVDLADRVVEMLVGIGISEHHFVVN